MSLSLLTLLLAATPAVDAVEEVGECTKGDLGVPGDRYVAARAAFADEVGFVDVMALPGVEGLVAVFDLDARGDLALPAPVTLPGSFLVHVDATRFQTLVDPLPEEGAEPVVVPTPCNNHIGPGARITTPVGGCTANVAFQDEFGRYYLSTAGHCIRMGERMSIPGIGAVGTAIFRISGGIGQDFAMVRLDPGLVPNPAMCHWGGPTGIAEGNPAGIVRHFGHGVIWGQNDLTRPRMAVTTANQPAQTSFQTNGLVSSGDSGSPARLDSGEHLGVITHVNLPLIFFAQSAPTFWGTQLAHGIARAEADTGLDFTLLTAPVAGGPV